MPPAFPTALWNSRPAIQVQTTRVAYQKSTSGQRFRTVFPPGALFSLLNPTPGLTEKGGSAFMQSHSCQLKSGLSAHMTDSSFLAKCLFLSTGLPLPSKKAKFSATCPLRPRRRRVPTGGPPASTGLPLPSRKQNPQPSAHVDLAVGASRPEVRSQYRMLSLLAKHLFSPIGLPLPSRKQNPQPSAHIALAVGASRPEVRLLP